jgi:DNA-binding MarR family transcriptional regulator
MQYSFKGLLGRISHQVSRDLGKYLEEKFQEAGYSINSHQWTVLSYLKEHQRSCQKDIARFMGTDKVMVKRIVDELEQSSFVLREEDPDDKRFNQVVMTSLGEALFDSLAPKAEDVLREAYEGIPDASINQCLETLQLISGNLEDKLKK